MIVPWLVASLSLLYTQSGLALPAFFQGKYVHGVRDILIEHETPQLYEDPYSHFFEQKVDHFDRSNLDTFKQRYFVNDTFWKGPDSGAPVFLCVGGEGPPFSYKVLIASDHCNDMVELAPQVGALLLALEHRYYGPSMPTPDYSTENLRFHNTEQALGDIAQFHSLITEKFSLTSANKWVSFGGSYPGMLASFARLRYPHLFHAAISSSAPTLAQVDMPEYNDIVASSMAAPSVGGSQQCLDIIVDGHKKIGDLLETAEGRKSLNEKFNLCNPLALENKQNQEVFAGNGVVYLPVQSNDPACTTRLCNIEKVCEFLLDDSLGEPIDRLAALSSAQHAGTCVSANYESVLDAFSNPKNPSRAWEYQTCTEWGFYQTCEVGTKCPYTQGLHTLQYDYDICKTAFNVDPETIAYNVDFANAMYGGDNPQSSRIMYVNGDIDPWHGLSVLTPPNSQEPTLMVDGASHHYWTHASLPTDGPNIVAARQAIWDQVLAWLAEDP